MAKFTGVYFSSLMVSQIMLYLQNFGKMSLATIVQSHIFALICTSLNIRKAELIVK